MMLETLGVKDVQVTLRKVLKNDFVAKVVVSEEKPLVFTYLAPGVLCKHMVGS